MNTIRIFRQLIGATAALCLAGAAAAQTATMTTPTVVYSAAGGSVTFNVSIQYTGVSLASLGFNVALPTGWSYASSAGTNPPTVPPEAGTTVAAEFAYITAPANSAVFSMVLNYAAGLSGSQTIAPTLIYKITGTANFVTVNLPNIVIAPAVSAVQAVPTKTLTAGAAAASFTPVTPANGAGPYTFAINPALPSALSLSASTGAITGTPAAASGPTNFTVTITDSTSATASNTFSLTVNPALTSTLAVASNALLVNTVATSFTPVTAAGGTTPYMFATNPALPAGLTMASGTGLVFGTPTVVSSATNYTVTVTDAAGATTSKVFSLTVNGPPAATLAIPSKLLTAGTAAVSFTPVTVAGGTAPLTFASNPALPASLVLNPATGAITGTPSVAAAATNYTITATDSLGATAGQTFSLTINGPVVATQAIPTRTLTAGTAAVAFTPVTATGGTGTLTYSVAPTLPPSLVLNPATGEITGTPAAGLAATVYTVTATDTVGATGSNTFSLTVSAALASAQAVPSRALTINTAAVPFTPVTISGGTGPFGYSVNPALPVGLSLGASTPTSAWAAALANPPC